MLKELSNIYVRTLDYGLWYPFDYSLVIIGYCNAHWIGNVEDRKNTSCACFLLVIVLLLCLVRNKILYFYLLLKLNILLLDVAVHNSYG